MKIRSDITVRTIEIQDDHTDDDINLKAAKALADQKLRSEGKVYLSFVEVYHARYNRAVVVYEH